MGNSEMEGIKQYLKEIGKFDLLTPEQEVQLAGRIKQGDSDARKEMISANLRLVVKIAKDYANYGLPLMDLISEGNIGLMKAVERFDPNKGGKLSTYAAWWIKQSIKRALANQSKTIRLPVHMVDKISKMRRVAMSMSEELGREPTDDELSEEIGIDRQKLSALKVASMRPSSLDAPVSAEDDTSFGEIVGDANALSASDLLISADDIVKTLPLLVCLDERERKIIDARFGLDGQKARTLEEVGQEFGVTRERIRQLQNIALRKLRRRKENLDNPIRSKTSQNSKKTRGNSVLSADFLAKVKAQLANATSGKGAPKQAQILSPVSLKIAPRNPPVGTNGTPPSRSTEPVISTAKSTTKSSPKASSATSFVTVNVPQPGLPVMQLSRKAISTPDEYSPYRAALMRDIHSCRTQLEGLLGLDATVAIGMIEKMILAKVFFSGENGVSEAATWGFLLRNMAEYRFLDEEVKVITDRHLIKILAELLNLKYEIVASVSNSSSDSSLEAPEAPEVPEAPEAPEAPPTPMEVLCRDLGYDISVLEVYIPEFLRDKNLDLGNVTHDLYPEMKVFFESKLENELPISDYLENLGTKEDIEFFTRRIGEALQKNGILTTRLNLGLLNIDHWSLIVDSLNN